MSKLRNKPSRDSRAHSFVGYSGIEILSDESSSISNRNLNQDILFHEREKDKAMADVSSLYSVSMREMQPSIDVSSGQQSLFRFRCHCTKSSASTVVTFLMMVIGVILVLVIKEDSSQTETVKIICQVIRAAGLFGFTGGITNWTSIRLIFATTSGLYCSGTLIKHFVEAKDTVANFILEAFFSPSQVHSYVLCKREYLLDPEMFDQIILKMINSDATSVLVEKKLDELMSTTEGLMLRKLGVTKSKLKPMILNYIMTMRTYISPLIISSLQSSELINPENIREQIVDTIASRTQQLSSTEVQKFVKLTIYKHLSWLVLWGNLFGAIIGCAVEIASIYTRGLPG